MVLEEGSSESVYRSAWSYMSLSFLFTVYTFLLQTLIPGLFCQGY